MHSEALASSSPSYRTEQAGLSPIVAIFDDMIEALPRLCPPQYLADQLSFGHIHKYRKRAHDRRRGQLLRNGHPSQTSGDHEASRVIFSNRHIDRVQHAQPHTSSTSVPFPSSVFAGMPKYRGRGGQLLQGNPAANIRRSRCVGFSDAASEIVRIKNCSAARTPHDLNMLSRPSSRTDSNVPPMRRFTNYLRPFGNALRTFRNGWTILQERS